jgi:nitroreductase
MDFMEVIAARKSVRKY